MQNLGHIWSPVSLSVPWSLTLIALCRDFDKGNQRVGISNVCADIQTLSFSDMYLMLDLKQS